MTRAPGLPVGTEVVNNTGWLGPESRVIVVLLIRFGAMSPLNASTICGTGALTIEPSSGEVESTANRCTLLTAASMLWAAAGFCAPLVIHCRITSVVDCGR